MRQLVFHTASGLSEYTFDEKEFASAECFDVFSRFVVRMIKEIHKDINKMKYNLPQDRFKYLCKIISKNSEKQL